VQTPQRRDEPEETVEAVVIGDGNHPLAGVPAEELRSLAPSEGTGVTGTVIPSPEMIPPPPTPPDDTAAAAPPTAP